MSSVTEVTDIEALLAPIPGDDPAGEDLGYSGLFDKIREARRADDALEQGEWKRETKVANWRQVETLATEALSGQTKDLRLCAWLGEALAKQYGFMGLRDGLRIIRGMCERFWDSVYPEVEDGDLEARSNAVTLFSERVGYALKQVPLTRAISGANCSYFDWEYSKDFDIPENLDSLGSEERQRAEEKKARAAREGKITSEQWRIAKVTTPRGFYEELYTVLDECWAEYQAFDWVIDAKFGKETPGLGALKKSLELIRPLIEKLVKEKRMLEPDPAEPEAVSAEGTVAGERGKGAAGGSAFVRAVGPIRNREEAFKRLADVAEYFRQAEPHNPVSYLVERAIRWGQMPLGDWLAEVVRNDGVLEQVRETLGLKASSDGHK